MGIRALCAAAAVVAGVGAVEAATFTVEQYDYRLLYGGTTFYNVVYKDYETQTEKDLGEIHSTADPFKIPHRFSELKAGDYVELHITAHIPDEPEYDTDGNGGFTSVCRIGPFDCSGIVRGVLPGLHLYNIGDLFDIKKIGDTITQSEDGYAGMFYNLEFGDLHYWAPTAEFTIVEDLAVAPVPLPATAALLPLGIGALALMRRRRRAVN